MSQNLVSLVVTPEQQAAALAALSQLEAALPGLISLEPGEARGLMFMGPKTETFGRGTIRMLAQNPQIVPPKQRHCTDCSKGPTGSTYPEAPAECATAPTRGGGIDV